jgi:phosphoribosylglycinamide formyltransferase-1
VKRLAVLASGTGTNLQALLDAISDRTLAAEIVVVVSDRPDAGALQRAASAGAAAVSFPLSDRRDARVREAFDHQLAEVIAAFHPDLVVLAGWMLVLSSPFFDRFAGKIVNVHPALLPDGDGDYVQTSRGVVPALRGHRVVRDALRQGLPLTGATVHFVTQEVDAGPVIIREEVPIEPDDDETRLHERIKSVEHRLLPQAVARALMDQQKGEDS